MGLVGIRIPNCPTSTDSNRYQRISRPEVSVPKDQGRATYATYTNFFNPCRIRLSINLRAVAKVDSRSLPPVAPRSNLTLPNPARPPPPRYSVGSGLSPAPHTSYCSVHRVSVFCALLVVGQTGVVCTTSKLSTLVGVQLVVFSSSFVQARAPGNNRQQHTGACISALACD